MWDSSSPVRAHGWACNFNWELSNGEDISTVTAVVLHSLEFLWAAHLVEASAAKGTLDVSCGKDGIGDSKMEALSAADLESFELVSWEHVWNLHGSFWSLDGNEWLMWYGLVGDGFTDCSLICRHFVIIY
jgi:hypothetical protein